jgi:maleylacetate reductase
MTMAQLTGTHIFSAQDRLVYGENAALVIAREAASIGLERIVVTTSPSVGRSDYFRSITNALGTRCVGVFDQCAPHSPRESVLGGAEAIRQGNADFVLAVGGGSVIDATKAMLGCVWLAARTFADLDRLVLEPDHLTASLGGIRMGAVPTTLSAAEFTPLAGITNRQTGTKELYLHRLFVPSLVILDPAATLGTPLWLILSTGVRSIDHCVETYLSTQPSPIGSALAREGLIRLAKGLRAVNADPGSLSARLDCQLGMWAAISGPVGGVPLGASHAIGRILGGALDVPHGHTSCVLLPAVLAWNESADDGRQTEIAAILSPRRECSAAEAIRSLIQELGMPVRLAEVGVHPEAFGPIAERSLIMLAHPTTCGNQRVISSAADVLEILKRAA